jgi:biotin operon repressor
MSGEKAEVRPGERVKAVAALEVLLRIWRQAVDCFPDDDLETILVYLTVAAASTTSHLRDPGLIAELDDGPLPDRLHRPTSGRAVAEATGLARETVRRRIDALVASGRLARDARGVRTITDSISLNRNLEFMRFLIHELTAASGRIGRFNIP